LDILHCVLTLPFFLLAVHFRLWLPFPLSVHLCRLSGSVLPSAGMMMYMQSAFLEHEYWMHPVVTPHGNGDMTVPVDELKTIVTQGLAAS